MIRLEAAPFDPAAELAGFSDRHGAAGGIASFVGIVRGEGKAGERIRAMTLEHYPGMTEGQLEAIDAEACRRWPLIGSLVIHRFGRMLPGEPIVLVAAASAHRTPAIEAMSFLIDWLKTRAPFWKLEETDQGERWVEARAEDDAMAQRWG